MISKIKRYSEKDITNVYSAISTIAPEALAGALFRYGGANPKEGDSMMERGAALALSRVKSMLRLIRSIQPDLEFSKEDPIHPWDPASIARISGKSWPSVLGMRVALPSGSSKRQRACMISNILMGMTSIR